MDDFEKKLSEIHERVLGKALTNEEQNLFVKCEKPLSAI